MKKSNGSVVVNVNDDTIIFNGNGISGSIIKYDNNKLKYFVLKLGNNIFYKKISKNKYEVDEAHFRNILYNDNIIKKMDKTIRFNETVEKDKQMFRPPSLSTKIL